jgi:hypothetical protein
MTDPTVDLFATEVAAAASLYGPEVDELALLVAGEPEEKVRDVLETLAAGLGDEFTGDLAACLFRAILERKLVIEQRGMSTLVQ